MADELARTTDGTLTTTERPSWIPAGDTTGTDGITADELRLPRLSIAQGLSAQITPGDASYIDGLKLFDLFNDLTGEVYGKGPLTFVCVKRVVRRIEFVPRAEGGGIVDMDVPPNDARMQWTQDDNGNRLPPRATRFVEFVVLLVKPGSTVPEPIVLSIKDTNKWNRQASERLTGFIKLPHPKFGNLPIYGKVYTIESGQGKNDKGTFGVPVIKMLHVKDGNGKDVPALLQDPTLGKFAMDFAESMRDKDYTVDREGMGSTDFDPVALENGR